MPRLGTLLCGIALFAGGAAAAQVGGAPAATRTIEVELREEGRLVGTPSVRVQVGRSTALAVGDYAMRLRMDRAIASGDGPAPFVVRSSVYRADGGWARVALPAVIVVEGEQAQLDFAGSDGRDLSLAVLVR